MTIHIEHESSEDFDFDVEETIAAVIKATADHEKCPYEAVVEVLLTDDEGIRSLNREFRGLDSPTDVLSFPMIEYEAPGVFGFLEERASADYFDPESGELLLGDIVISMEKVGEQARRFGHSEKRELAFLVAHSMMHLFGYDHVEEGEAVIMEKRQEEVLESLKITRSFGRE